MFLRLMNSLKIHPLSWQRRNLIQVILRQQSFLEKFFRTDEQGVAGKRGIACVRRITVAGWTQRQNLPQTLATGDEKIREAIRLIAQVADAETSRQRCRVKQDAAGSGKGHLCSPYARGRTSALSKCFESHRDKRLLFWGDHTNDLTLRYWNEEEFWRHFFPPPHCRGTNEAVSKRRSPRPESLCSFSAAERLIDDDDRLAWNPWSRIRVSIIVIEKIDQATPSQS